MTEATYMCRSASKKVPTHLISPFCFLGLFSPWFKNTQKNPKKSIRAHHKNIKCGFCFLRFFLFLNVFAVAWACLTCLCSARRRGAGGKCIADLQNRDKTKKVEEKLTSKFLSIFLGKVFDIDFL
jgi:hypothetical protein